MDWFFGNVGHESNNGEDDNASKHAGEGVYATHNDGISATWRTYMINICR